MINFPRANLLHEIGVVGAFQESLRELLHPAFSTSAFNILFVPLVGGFEVADGMLVRVFADKLGEEGLNSALRGRLIANAALQFDQGQVAACGAGVGFYCALPIGFTDQLLLRAR